VGLGTEISTHLNACFRLLSLDTAAVESFGTSREAARRSFITLIWRLPFVLVIGYFGNLPFMTRYEVGVGEFLAGRFVAFFLAIALTLALVNTICRLEGLSEKFYQWIVGFMWMNVLFDLILLPVMVVPLFLTLSHDSYVLLGIFSYLFMIYGSWAFTWRILKCNPFLAVGIAIVPFMVKGMLTDYLNIRIYGVAKPFFE
jgi:hypothetical protein